MRIGDGYGEMLLAALEEEGDVVEIVERDDGFISAGRFGPSSYLAPYAKWPSRQRRALRLARGRILDAGAGGGRVALRLQERGHEVVSIDSSPGSIEVCRRRGIRDVRVMKIEDVDVSVGVIDTVIMYGNNLGLLASRTHARRILGRLHGVTSDRARILAETLDPYTTSEPLHLAYHERNRRRGRMGGQIRLRVRFRDVATPWFDYLFVSQNELHSLLEGTGWRLARAIEDPEPPQYVAVIEKTEAG